MSVFYWEYFEIFKNTYFISESTIIAASWETPHFGKQMMMILFGIAFHIFGNKVMVERIEMEGRRAFLSKTDISVLTTNNRYLAFKTQMIPWSRGCVTEVKLGESKIVLPIWDFRYVGELYNCRLSLQSFFYSQKLDLASRLSIDHNVWQMADAWQL